MRLTLAAAISACCATAHAFDGTSPFLMFGTSKFQSISLSLPSKTKVQDESHKILESCPTKHYLLATQPNINIKHLASSAAAPKLQAAMNSEKIPSRVKVSEMVGTIDIKTVEDFLRRSCEAAGKTVSIEILDLAPLPTSSSEKEAQDALKASDEDLGLVLSQYDMSGDYTVIFTAGKSTGKAEEAKVYEAEFEDTTHQELKRQLGQPRRRAAAKDNRPLFEKYQFFTPGIFMVLITLIILFSILGVGIAALGSLQVPYAAFEKEMGPSHQKKQ